MGNYFWATGTKNRIRCDGGSINTPTEFNTVIINGCCCVSMEDFRLFLPTRGAQRSGASYNGSHCVCSRTLQRVLGGECVSVHHLLPSQ